MTMELLAYGLNRSTTSSQLSTLSIGGRSCEFSTHSSGCIEKAKINLTVLESNLRKWQADVISYTQNLKEQSEKKLLKFRGTNIRAGHIQLEAIRSGTELEVCGLGIKQPQGEEENKENHSASEPVEEIPSIHQNIVENVMTLVERFETDRSSMADLLKMEQERCQMLREKIDWHAYRRIHELPKAVQEEHERCAYDLQELRWHCSYKGRIEERIKEKVRVAENINKKILDEIQFVKENRPLIENKLQAESDAMKLVQENQIETNDKVKQALSELGKTEWLFEVAKKKADAEQKTLGRRVLTLSNSLKEALGRHLDAQEYHEKMSCDITRMSNTISTHEENLIQLGKNVIRVSELETVFEEKVETANEDICNATSDFQKFTEQNNAYTEKLRMKNLELNEMTKSFNKSMRNKTTELQKLLRKNKNCSKDIQMLKKKIDNCEKQKRNDAKSIQRAVAEKNKIYIDLKVIKEETHNLRSRYEQLLLKLDKERIRAAEIEENLHIQNEALKKQSKEEAHARMILQARISVDQADFLKQKEESERRREKLLKAETDINNVLKAVNTQVDKLNSKCEERFKTIENINSLLDQVSTKYTEIEEQLSREINKLSPQDKELTENAKALRHKLDETTKTTTEIDKKLRDMASSSVMMNKLLLANENAISDLNDELKELQIQLDSGQGLDKILRESLKQVHERSKNLVTEHEDQIKIRRVVFEEITSEFLKAHGENKELARQYVILQNRHITDKNDFINAYEKAIIAQETLDDKRTLCELHARLQEALKCYYQLRGIQTRAGLSRFEQMTMNSNQKIETIQKELETSTRNISEFLNATNKSHKYIQVKSSVAKRSRRILKVAT